MAVVKVRPRDLKPNDRWRHWTGEKYVTFPVIDVTKVVRDGSTAYRVRLDVPHRDRNHYHAVRYVRPYDKVEIEKEH